MLVHKKDYCINDDIAQYILNSDYNDIFMAFELPSYTFVDIFLMTTIFLRCFIQFFARKRPK